MAHGSANLPASGEAAAAIPAAACPRCWRHRRRSRAPTAAPSLLRARRRPHPSPLSRRAASSVRRQRLPRRRRFRQYARPDPDRWDGGRGGAPVPADAAGRGTGGEARTRPRVRSPCAMSRGRDDFDVVVRRPSNLRDAGDDRSIVTTENTRRPARRPSLLPLRRLNPVAEHGHGADLAAASRMQVRRRPSAKRPLRPRPRASSRPSRRRTPRTSTRARLRCAAPSVAPSATARPPSRGVAAHTRRRRTPRRQPRPGRAASPPRCPGARARGEPRSGRTPPRRTAARRRRRRGLRRPRAPLRPPRRSRSSARARSFPPTADRAAALPGRRATCPGLPGRRRECPARSDRHQPPRDGDLGDLPPSPCRPGTTEETLTSVHRRRGGGKAGSAKEQRGPGTMEVGGRTGGGKASRV